RWAATGVAIELVLPLEAIQRVSQPDQSILAALDMLEGVTLKTGKAAPILHGSSVLAEIEQGGRVTAWASMEDRAIPDSNWADCGGSVLVRGALEQSATLGDCIKFELSTPENLPAQTVRVEVGNEFDGPADGFGHRMVEGLQ